MFTDARFTENNSVAFGTHVGLFNIWAIQIPYDAAVRRSRVADIRAGPDGVRASLRCRRSSQRC